MALSFAILHISQQILLGANQLQTSYLMTSGPCPTSHLISSIPILQGQIHKVVHHYRMADHNTEQTQFLREYATFEVIGLWLSHN